MDFQTGGNIMVSKRKNREMEKREGFFYLVYSCAKEVK